MTLATGGIEDLFHSFREIVDALHVRRDVFSIVDVGDTGRYVQMLSDCDGTLVMEVSPNDAAKTAVLTAQDEVALLRLGFQPPCNESPNWHRFLAEPWPWPAPVIAELLVRTLVNVFDARPRDLRLTIAHTVAGIPLYHAARACEDSTRREH